MTQKQKRVLLTLVLIGLIYFVIFIFPNGTGAKDRSMLSMFEPDEYAQISHLEKMFRFEDVFTHTLYKLIAYGHYYYGYPFYFTSFLTLLPVYWLAGPISRSSQLSMLLLRQVVSVAPVVLACLVMVFAQTKFRSYIASIVSFVFILSIPAVVENNMWWHPDSLTVLFIALTFLFLDRDQLSFGKNFYFAAIACGLATGTKVMGLFFFLAIPIYILMGLLQNKLTWKKATLTALGFVALMSVTIVVSNPFLLLPNLFDEMVRIQSGQAQAMSAGWTLFYTKGPASWVPILNELYAAPWFFAVLIVILLFGIIRDQKRILNTMILAWIVPLASYILFFVAIKPTHFFLPIAVPLFSCIALPFEALSDFKRGNFRTALQNDWKFFVSGLVIVAAVGYQTIVFINHDIKTYREVLTREQRNPELNFYSNLEENYLKKIPPEESLVVYRDVRMYYPEGSGIRVRSFFNTSTYADLENKKPDLVILWRQRIWDYTGENAAQNAIDPTEFHEVERFFSDAKNNTLRGYVLIYEDQTGLAFVSNALYEKYFQQ